METVEQQHAAKRGPMQFRWSRLLGIVVLSGLTGIMAGCGNESQGGRQPTVETGATQIATPYIPGNQPSLAGPVQIAQVTVDSPDSVVFIQNVGAGGSGSTASEDVSGWKLEAGSTTVTLPEATRLPPGSTLAVHTGVGSQTPVPATTAVSVSTPQSTSTLYLGPSGEALSQALQPGATVLLVDSRGTVVSQGVVPTR